MSRPCTNCEAPLPDPLPPFCPACGQETRVRAPTLGEFAQQFGGAFLSTEGALARTLKLLLTRPGELTRQYLAGRRKHYVLPLRLYLTISVLVLLLMRLLAQFAVDGNDAVRVDPQDRMVISFGSSRAGVEDGRFFCENFPQWLCRRFQRRMDVAPQALEREARQVGERFMSNLGAAMFVLLPAFALLMKIAYLNRRLRYTEHLVFALHLHAFWFIAVALTLANLPLLTLAALIAAPLYALVSMRRVYGGRWWPLLLRAAFVSLCYLVVLALALAGVALWSVLF